MTNVNVTLADNLEPLTLASLQGRVTQRVWGTDDGGGSLVSAGRDGIRVTQCEVCGSFAEVLRIADTRAPRALSASERQRLVDRGG